jgi:two-component system nitrate/nitrite sensor histidine kinase NarX
LRQEQAVSIGVADPRVNAAWAGAASAVDADAATAENFDEQLERFLHAIVKLTHARAGAVRLLTDDERSMRLVGSVGLPPDFVERERLVPVGCGVCGAALQHPQGLQAANAEICRARTASIFFADDCRHVLALPLEHKGWVFGVYNLFMPDERPLPADMPALLRVLGDMFGAVLHDARRHNQTLAKSVTSERRIIAGELHDSVVQSLMYMKMRMVLLEDAIRAAPAGRAADYLADIRGALDNAYTDVRRLLTHFRSSMDPRGLMTTLRALAESHEARTGVAFNIDNRAGDLVLRAEQELQIFLIVQEALTNVVRHAHARTVSILLERDAEMLNIAVDDDGSGIRAGGTSPEHYGLSIMQERAAQIGGVLQLSERAEGGTRVLLQVPLRGSAR